jgi:sugar phosphate isomerase/epimerase
VRIGCHGVLYREAIAERTDEVLAALASTGCEGIELGSRFFPIEANLRLRDALDRHELTLAGLHAVVPLAQVLDEPEAAEAALTEAARFLEVMPMRNLICTGMVDMAHLDAPDFGDARLQDPAATATLAERLDGIAQRIFDRHGATLRYHNHSWEFAHDSAIYSALLAHAPHLGLALDTGWAAVSGVDPVDLITSAPERFGYFHLRDVDRKRAAAARTYAELSGTYPEFGLGDIDAGALLAAIQQVAGVDGWGVVEYEWGEQEPARYARAVTFVRESLGG